MTTSISDLLFQVAKANVESAQVAFKSGYDAGYKILETHCQALQEQRDILAEALQKAALCLDDMEKANAMLNRDVMAATCLVISNEIRNALANAGVK